MTTERRSFIDPTDRLFRPSVRFFYSADRVFLSVKPTALFFLSSQQRAFLSVKPTTSFFLSSRPNTFRPADHLFFTPSAFYHADRAFLSVTPTAHSFYHADRAFLSVTPTAHSFYHADHLFFMPTEHFSFCHVDRAQRVETSQINRTPYTCSWRGCRR